MLARNDVVNTSGDKYHGEIDGDTGLPHGRGHVEMANGDKFDGLMEMGRRKFGSLKLTNEIVYTGDFADEVPSGMGSIKWPSGHVYEGRHTKYVLERGIYTFPDGERHDGKWSENAPSADEESIRKYVNGRRSIGKIQRLRMFQGRGIFKVWFTITKGVRVVEVWNGEEYTRESVQFIEAEDLEHEDVFIEACSAGDFFRARKILMKKPKLAQFAIAGEEKAFSPAIVVAAGNGHVDIVRLLLDNGADVGVVNANLENAVHVAVMGGHFEVVELIASRSLDYASLLEWGLPHPIDAQNKEGQSPFEIAANMLNMLIDGKRRNEVQDVANVSTLERKSWEACLRTLMIHGANPGNVDALPLVIDAKSIIASLLFFVNPSNEVIVQRYIRDYKSLPAKLTPRQRRERGADAGLWCILR